MEEKIDKKTKEEIIEDIHEKGVTKEIAEKEEKIAEKTEEKFEEQVEKQEKEKITNEDLEINEEISNEELYEGLKIRGEDEESSDEESEGEREKRLKELEAREKIKESIASWNPKTKLGKEVKQGKIKKIDEILDDKRKILEEKIVDSLIQVKSELISIGQSKGKFGGGKRRAWRQTQRKTEAKNIPSFSTMVVVGDENGHVGVGIGKAKETLPARDKALRKAKLNIIKVVRDCSGFDCACSEKHTVPFKVEGKSGSVRVVLIPAAQGTGLVVANELKKVLKLAGIKDVYSKTFGKKRTTFNLVNACIEALKKTNRKEK